MKHVNKWPLALYVCMNSIFKCFIGNRIEWSHIEWHFFSNWQVLLIQTSPCYCLLGSIYSLVKMYARVGKGTLAFLADPGLLGVRDLSLPQVNPPLPLHRRPQEEGESEQWTWRRSNAWRKPASLGFVPAQCPCTVLGVTAHLSFPRHVAGCKGCVWGRGGCQGRGALKRAACGWHFPGS